MWVTKRGWQDMNKYQIMKIMAKCFTNIFKKENTFHLMKVSAAIYFVCLTKAVYPSHFSFLVWIAQNTAHSLLASYSQNKIFSTLLRYVFTKFPQKTGCPLLFHFRSLVLNKQKEEINKQEK